MHQVKAVSRLIHKENMKKQLEMRKRLSSLPGGADAADHCVEPEDDGIRPHLSVGGNIFSKGGFRSDDLKELLSDYPQAT